MFGLPQASLRSLTSAEVDEADALDMENKKASRGPMDSAPEWLTRSENGCL